ncbi:MAG: trigger factor [Clostridia bacterium]|nr:trigger factor [Clostridia bacterium]
MSHTYEKVSGNKARLNLTIPAEKFDEATQAAYLKLRHRINVPGFRKGKAPRKMIETLYGEDVFFDEAVNQLLPEAYEAAVEEFDLKPVDRPQADIEEIGKGKDLKLKVEVFVRPDVTLGEYRNLTVQVNRQKLTDEMIDARIEQDRDKASRTVEIEDRPVQDGDTVNLDYAGTVDGVAFDGGTAQDQTLRIGSHTFIPGFEEQMIGLSIGEEKDLNVTFPEEYHQEDLKGKAAVFHVKVNGIQTTEKPELDDDFAADVSEYNTFDEYRAAIVKELQERIDRNNEAIVENALLEKIRENTQIDIPEAMIEDEAEYLLQEMAMRMSYQGISLDDYMKYTGTTRESLIEMQKPDARIRVINDLVLEEIRKAEKIEATEEEVEKEIAEQAERMGQETEAFKENLTESQKNYLKNSATIRKTLEFLRKSATVEDKPAEEPKQEETEKPEKAAKKPARKAAKKAEDPAEKDEPAAEKKPARRTARKAQENPEEKTDAE